MTLGTPGVAVPPAAAAAAAELGEVVEKTLPNVDEMEAPDAEPRRVTTVSLSFCNSPFIVPAMSVTAMSPLTSLTSHADRSPARSAHVTNWPRIGRVLAAATAVCLQCESKNPSWRLLTFSPNGWEFLVQILHACYRFPTTLDYKFSFIYLQLWRSYAILNATIQFKSYA